MVDLAANLADVPDALADFVHALALAATYDPSLVSPLANAWPRLMAIGLTAVAQPDVNWHGAEHLIQNLIPDPTAVPWEGDIDAVLTAARANWLTIQHVREHIDEWLTHAQGVRWCVDALVGFLKAQPLTSQIEYGLPWVRALIVSEDGTARTSGFLLIGWLEQIRESGILGSAAWSDYRAIVDALVLSDYAGARDLQQRDE